MKNLLNNMSKIWFFIFFILLLVIYIIIQLTSPIPKKELTIATGIIGSDSYAYGMSYKALLEEDGVKLNVIPTKGSLDTLNYLKSKKADVGFVHSGVLRQKREYNFESLASVYKEPLWIFYRDKGYNVNYIIEAVGQKIALSATNDGTLDLAQKLSSSNQLMDKVILSYSYDRYALKQLKDKKIDFFITLAAKDNQYVQELLRDSTIKLMDVKRFKAYIQKYKYLTYIDLFEGSIDLYRNIPSSDMHILSTTQNLVTRDDVPQELIRILLKKVKDIHGDINMDYIDTLPNEEAKIYMEHGESWLETIFPYWIASNIDRLKLFLIPLIWLIIPLFKSIIPLYIFTTRSKIFKWYEKLDNINEKIINKEDKNLIIKNMNILKDEIETKTHVPLAYKGEYYNLIVHIELLDNKIKQL